MFDRLLLRFFSIFMVGQALLICDSVFGAYKAPEPFLKNEVVQVKVITSAVPRTVSDKKWSKAQKQIFKLHTQQTVRLNDRDANEYLKNQKPLELHVRALASAQQLALLLEWKDENPNLATGNETRLFGDSVAVQFPYVFGEGHRLPYVGMGDDKYPVVAYLGRATQKGTLLRTTAAVGFGSSTRQKKSQAKMNMSYDKKDKMWRAIWYRSLKEGGHSLKQSLIPVAFAVWDGDRYERGGNKSLSSWKFLKLENLKASEKYLENMAFGYAPGDLGDKSKGKTLALQSCAACHHFEGVTSALSDFAPDLSQIGKIATFSYLRDSILSPSEVVVRNLNQNRHYSKVESSEVGKRGYPNNPSYLWYSKDQGGKLISKMPPFGYLSKEDLSNLLAFMKEVE